MSRIPLLVDADPAIGYWGRDVDDGLALLAALSDPGLEVLGVTVTFGNVPVRRGVSKALEVLRRAGRGDIPVYEGASGPRDLGRETDASEFLRASVRAQPGAVVAAIGPLSNVAQAASDPDVVTRLGGLWVLGGVLGAPARWTRQAGFEFNLRQDVEAARRVLAAPWRCPLVVFPMETCRQVTLGARALWRLWKMGGTTRWAVQESLVWAALAPAVWGAWGFHPWDVLPILGLTQPGLFTFEEREISVGEQGELRPGSCRARVAVGVQRDALYQALFARFSWSLVPSPAPRARVQ